MNEFYVVFQRRDYSDFLAKPALAFRVERFSMRAVGGPFRASIVCQGSAFDLWELLEFLGYPVTIYDREGREAWWGYVNETRINSREGTGQLLCNGWWDRLGWRYCLVSTTATVESTTQISSMITAHYTWCAGVDIESASGISFNEYRAGDRTVKQEAEDLLKVGTTNSKRLLALAQSNRRIRLFEEPGASDLDCMIAGDCEFGVSLDTMFNRTYAYYTEPGSSGRHNTATADDTTSQGEYGMKSLNLSLNSVSATAAEAYRDEALARMKYPIPKVTLDGRTGRILNNMGLEMPVYLCPVGAWVKLKDMIPANADTSRIADCTKIFVEEWEYGGGEMRLTPRDVPGPYDLVNVE